MPVAEKRIGRAGEAWGEAEVQLQVLKSLNDYDERKAVPRHEVLLTRLDEQDEKIAGFTSTQDQFLGGQKVLMYILAGPSIIAAVLSIVRFFRGH